MRAIIFLTIIAFHISPASEILQQEVTTEELASALGIRPFCADLILDGSLYPRLVAEIKDTDGTIREESVTPGGGPHKIYRIRVFLFEDGRSRVPKRMIFNLSADDNVAGNVFIDFPSGGLLVKTTISKSEHWFYEAWIFAPNSPKDFYRVRLRIETQPIPYPVSSSIINTPAFSTSKSLAP